MKRISAVFMLSVFLMGRPGQADEFSENPEKSFFIGFDLGAGLNPDRETRSPPDLWGEDDPAEAYSLGAFLFGVFGGYRFNEIIGIEAGWHELRHRAHEEWGSVSYFQMSHFALRLAWPLPSRQTPVLRMGPALGAFSYGSASYGGYEDNSTFVLGGFIGLTLEHEFTLGIVGVLELAYLPLYRFGMDGVLELREISYDYNNEIEDLNDNETDPYLLDIKDFENGRFVHLIWISAGFQFEWTFR
ncbi:MAG: hypothetical protein GY847_32605 [Proteobacteria bacterium]|nr:hypothetical protein [Pseudomonadota bacterium]